MTPSATDKSPDLHRLTLNNPASEAPNTGAMLTDAELAVVKADLLALTPRLKRRHMVELADLLHDAVRERRIEIMDDEDAT